MGKKHDFWRKKIIILCHNVKTIPTCGTFFKGIRPYLKKITIIKVNRGIERQHNIIP